MILRCLSYNIWKNEGDYPRRMAAIAALCPDARAMAETPAGHAPDNGAIDHVLLFARQTGARQTKARMINRRVIAAPDLSGFPSDHPAILAEIEFP